MRIVLLGLALIPGGPVLAQATAAQTTSPPPATTAEQADTTTLDAVQVTAPRLAPETVNLYRFRNPVEVQQSRFGESWREPPSLGEIGEQGGIIPLVVGYLAQKVGQGTQRIPGWKQQIEYATARPPPLDEGQQQRAAALRQDGEPAQADD